MERRIIDDRSLGRGMPFHMSWGALFGGAIAALGIWILLYVLGLALGLSTMNPNDTRTLYPSSVFTGLWGLVAPLIALFVGGMIAGRSVGAVSRGGGAIHGLVVWAIALLGGVCLVATVFGSAVGTVVGVGKTVAAQAMTAPRPADRDTVVGKIQERLHELQAGTTQRVQKDVIEAAPEAGTALWVAFGALGLGLLAAVGGGAAGVTRGQRRVAEVAVEATTAAAEVAVTPAQAAAVQMAAGDPLAREAQLEDLRRELADLRAELRETLHH